MPDAPSLSSPARPRARPRLPALGERLRERARALGLSNAEVARRANIGVRQYQHYVAGERQPAPAVLARIAAVLDTTADELIGGEWHGVDDPRSFRAERAIRDGLTDLAAEDREVIADLVDTLRTRRRQARAAEVGLAMMAAHQNPVEALAVAHERFVPALVRAMQPLALQTQIEGSGGRPRSLLIILEFARDTDMDVVDETLRSLALDTIGRVPEVIPSPRRTDIVLRLSFDAPAKTVSPSATRHRP